MINNDTITYTDSFGRFRIQMPLDKSSDSYHLTVQKKGYSNKDGYYKTNCGTIEIRLDR